MGRKLSLTKQILETLENPPTREVAMLTWWANIQDTGGMGLTNEGFRVFTKELDLKYYDWDYPNNKSLSSRIMLAMDRKMEYPYYIKQPKGKRTPGKIFLFGERDAVLINLCGDLTKFVENTLSS